VSDGWVALDETNEHGWRGCSFIATRCGTPAAPRA